MHCTRKQVYISCVTHLQLQLPLLDGQNPSNGIAVNFCDRCCPLMCISEEMIVSSCCNIAQLNTEGDLVYAVVRWQVHFKGKGNSMCDFFVTPPHG